MTRQLVLDLPVRSARGREDFFVSPANAQALAALDGWADWPQGKAVLCGPAGAGKSHLAQVWAEATGATVLPASALVSANLPHLARGPVAVEDAGPIGGDRAAETALFHLHNLMAEGRRPLLVTAASPPRDWGLTLPDLASRMQAAPLIRLDPPDDTLLRAVLVKLFADRQVQVAPQVIDYLIPRMTRSLAAAGALVAALDARALAEGRPITRAMAADWFDGPGLFDRD